MFAGVKVSYCHKPRIPSLVDAYRGQCQYYALSIIIIMAGYNAVSKYRNLASKISLSYVFLEPATFSLS